MFEIYREADYARQYRIVFFTELDEHNKESEIGRAMAGEHFFDGFVPELRIVEAKNALADVIRELNRGTPLGACDVAERLKREGLLVE